MSTIKDGLKMDIELNTPSMIALKGRDELYKIACQGGAGSETAISELRKIYPKHKMTNETIRDAIIMSIVLNVFIEFHLIVKIYIIRIYYMVRLNFGM